MWCESKVNLYLFLTDSLLSLHSHPTTKVTNLKTVFDTLNFNFDKTKNEIFYFIFLLNYLD